MALEKKIELENGVTVNYHRIVSINKIINNSTIIEISSYTSKDKRIEEKDKVGNYTNIYINTTYINKEYNEKENIQDIYNYLKTTDNFSNAEDV